MDGLVIGEKSEKLPDEFFHYDNVDLLPGIVNRRCAPFVRRG
jgi:hypothetical protein